MCITVYGRTGKNFDFIPLQSGYTADATPTEQDSAIVAAAFFARLMHSDSAENGQQIKICWRGVTNSICRDGVFFDVFFTLYIKSNGRFREECEDQIR